MKKGTTIILIILGILILGFIHLKYNNYFLNTNSTLVLETEFNQKYTETVLLNNVSLDNTTYIDVIKRVIPQDNSPEINKILINDGSSSIVLEELLPAGYNSTNIKDSFVFNSYRSRYLIFITSWDSDNKALDISGIFYEILIFNEKLERLPAIEDLFFNFESKTEKEELNLIRGNKDLVIQKLQELESEGKL